MPIFLTGRGLVSPAGLTTHDLWDAISRGVPRLVQEPLLGPCGKLPLAAETVIDRVRDQKKALRTADRAVLLGVLAARDAYAEALQAELALDPDTTAVVCGSSRGATATLEREHDAFLERGKVSATTSPHSTQGAFAAAVAQDLGLGGLAVSVSSACTTGLNALGVGAALLEAGQCTAVIAGGAEASLTPFTIAQLRAAGVLAKAPSALFPCRPLHPERTGLIPGEGAACVVLTQDPRGALARFGGFGSSSEPSTPTGVSPDGLALGRAMRRALNAAELDPADIDLVVGHGASTRQGDAAELNAYRDLFGMKLPPITFHKWATGHMIGASGAVSAVLATLHLATGDVPALPYWEQDVPVGGKTALHLTRARHVMVCAMGFGGNASAVIISRV